MSSCNRPRYRCNGRYSAFVTPKMADFLGCNPVTPFSRREWGKGKFSGCFELARRSVILIYTYIYCILARYLSTPVSPSSNPFSPTPSPESGLQGYNPQKCWVFGVTLRLPKTQERLARGYKPASPRRGPRQISEFTPLFDGAAGKVESVARF
jgi:hypothetical protein